MNLHTKNLIPPPCTTDPAIRNAEPLISETDYRRRQAEIAHCLADFQAKWMRGNDGQPEPLADVIPFPLQPAPLQQPAFTDEYSHDAG